MFIPQAKAMSPALAGVNSIATGSFSGNALLMFKEGNTTSVPHVLSVVRTNVMRAVRRRARYLRRLEALLVHDHLRGLGGLALPSSLDDAGVALAFAVLPPA